MTCSARGSSMITLHPNHRGPGNQRSRFQSKDGEALLRQKNMTLDNMSCGICLSVYLSMPQLLYRSRMFTLLHCYFSFARPGAGCTTGGTVVAPPGTAGAEARSGTKRPVLCGRDLGASSVACTYTANLLTKLRSLDISMSTKSDCLHGIKYTVMPHNSK